MFLAIIQAGDKMDSLKEKIRELEREEILNALRECGWVMARAARKLGITERMIGYKIRKYGIRKEEREGMGEMHLRW
jgi:Nif-specific regulatory protein